MAYKELIDTLLKDGERQRRELIRKAQAEADRILFEAKDEAARLDQSTREKVRRRSENDRARILGRARLQARGLRLKAKHELIDQVLGRARERLSAAGDDPTNEAMLVRQIADSLAEMGKAGGKALLHQNAPRRLEQEIRKRGIAVERVDEAELWFGFRIVSADSDRSVTDSYPLRLERNLSEVLIDLNSFLFGSQHAG